MYILFIALVIIACILLVFIVLIQNPKGGGLSSGFAGSNNLMGVQRTGDILEKGTWVLVLSIMVLSLLINITTPTASSDSQGIELQKQIAPTSAPATGNTLSIPQQPSQGQQKSPATAPASKSDSSK
ncbi:protein translocase subunit secG [bacterium A37T11]|nr:protein translocase subunit secG [bacterium A37T11]